MAGHVKVRKSQGPQAPRRKVHIRLRVTGTAERPRLSVFRSARYVYAQAIDDTTGRVLAAASELEATVKAAGRRQGEEGARSRRRQGRSARSSIATGVKAVVFDRNGFIYHGRVKEVADGARDAGLKF